MPLVVLFSSAFLLLQVIQLIFIPHFNLHMSRSAQYICDNFLGRKDHIQLSLQQSKLQLMLLSAKFFSSIMSNGAVSNSHRNLEGEKSNHWGAISLYMHIIHKYEALLLVDFQALVIYVLAKISKNMFKQVFIFFL